MRLSGEKGEDLAARFLKRKGYKILHRNWRAPGGEIDIIARHGETIVFVEVKTRADGAFAPPYESVDDRKRRRIRAAALHFFATEKAEFVSRFDVISIEGKGKEREITHIEDAFEA